MKPSRHVLLPIGLACLGLVPRSAGAQAAAHSDLAIVSNTASVKHPHVGDRVTFTIVAKNNGPDPVVSVYVRYADLQGLRVVQESCDRGVSPDTPYCEYTNLQPGQTLTTIVIAEVTGPGDSAALTAVVSSPDPIDDPNAGNDSATASLKVVGRR